MFDITWREFAWAEGFDGIVPLLNFFSKERYIEKDLKTFFFEVFVRINTFNAIPLAHCRHCNKAIWTEDDLIMGIWPRFKKCGIKETLDLLR